MNNFLSPYKLPQKKNQFHQIIFLINLNNMENKNPHFYTFTFHGIISSQFLLAK